MSNENRILSITLALMVAAIFWMIMSDAMPEGEVDADVFRVNRQEEIDGVELISSSDTVHLHYTGARWQVNAAWAADRRMISVFFATLDQMRPVREVRGAEADSARRWLHLRGVAVTLFKKSVPVFQFRAGGNPMKTLAYFIHPAGAVYAMHIPGYRVYASGIFETGVAAWREKRLFDFNWQNFKSLALISRESAYDFEILFNGTSFGIANFETDTARLNSYLDDVSLMAADAFYQHGSLPAPDSVLQHAPAFEIRVRDVGSRTYRLEVFAPLPRGQAVVARLNGETLLLSRKNAAVLAKKKSYFQRPRAR